MWYQCNTTNFVRKFLNVNESIYKFEKPGVNIDSAGHVCCTNLARQSSVRNARCKNRVRCAQRPHLFRQSQYFSIFRLVLPQLSEKFYSLGPYLLFVPSRQDVELNYVRWCCGRRVLAISNSNIRRSWVRYCFCPAHRIALDNVSSIHTWY